MMTLSRLQRTLDAGHHRTLVNAVSANGRPVPGHLLNRMLEPNVVRAAAESMALLRGAELVYGRAGADLSRLVSAVLDRQSARSGAFRDDGHPRTGEPDRSIFTTVLCTRALLEALQSGSLAAEETTAVRAAVQRGLTFLAEAFNSEQRSVGGVRGSVEAPVCPDDSDRALIAWLLGSVPGDFAPHALTGRNVDDGIGDNRRGKRKINREDTPTTRSCAVRDRHQRLLFPIADNASTDVKTSGVPVGSGSRSPERVGSGTARNRRRYADTPEVVRVLRAATPGGPEGDARLPFQRAKTGGQHRGAPLRSFPECSG